MTKNKKIDILIWLKGVDEDSEGDVLKDAAALKKHTNDIVVVAGPPEKLLAPEAQRDLLGQDPNDNDTPSKNEANDGKS